MSSLLAYTDWVKREECKYFVESSWPLDLVLLFGTKIVSVCHRESDYIFQNTSQSTSTGNSILLLERTVLDACRCRLISIDADWCCLSRLSGWKQRNADNLLNHIDPLTSFCCLEPKLSVCVKGILIIFSKTPRRVLVLIIVYYYCTIVESLVVSMHYYISMLIDADADFVSKYWYIISNTKCSIYLFWDLGSS